MRLFWLLFPLNYLELIWRVFHQSLESQPKVLVIGQTFLHGEDFALKGKFERNNLYVFVVRGAIRSVQKNIRKG